ncbi:hypothetical protein EVAR_63315_1 [Eumeta japonica]|uniref:Uncharacterized protein n=1 Tax=Eumeta variegata TaxID=151549 RepID=A0A4C1YLF4_EUMVA|nr:hypothetical protein EVAR_63315_1 [Eumeta japonica]
MLNRVIIGSLGLIGSSVTWWTGLGHIVRASSEDVSCEFTCSRSDQFYSGTATSMTAVSLVVVCTMWRRVVMRKRLCDFLLTRFDGAVYYVHSTVNRLYIYPNIAWRPVATAKRCHANNPVYPTPIDVPHR